MNAHVPTVAPLRRVIRRRYYTLNVMSKKRVNLNHRCLWIYEGLTFERIEEHAYPLRHHSVKLVLALLYSISFAAVLSNVRLPIVEIEVYEHVVVE